MSDFNQSDFKRNTMKGLKSIGKHNTVIHCHHYNARLQRTLESNALIDGKLILRSSAAKTYYKILTNLIDQSNKPRTFEMAADLYRFLGFGILDFSKASESIVSASHSHYVQGWNCGSIKMNGTVCRPTEGFIEAAYKAIKGEDVKVQETTCMNQNGEHQCSFNVTKLAEAQYDFSKGKSHSFDTPKASNQAEAQSNIKKELIIETVMGMPLEGNNEGLIPAFNVYLAHTPQDFYNEVSIRFIDEMSANGLDDLATEMLVEDAENCALNTFGGILGSDEWSALIQPMIKEERDRIFGLIAVANALGWGRIAVLEHTAAKSLLLTSQNGYEAYGYIEDKGKSEVSNCHMLRGISSGLMGLVYEQGEIADRCGVYKSIEKSCLTKGDHCCEFHVCSK
tara:strand:+ start:1273 stop:2457 length:1185 start_codon:yes stop_codon:yes gene_type:complete